MRRKVQTLLAVIVLATMLFRLGGALVNTYRVGERNDALAQEINTLEQEKKFLEGEVAYRQTDEFVEKEARERLFMAKQGESVVVIKGSDDEKKALGARDRAVLSIPEQWRDLFWR